MEQQINSADILRNSKKITCENCGCMFFKQVFSLRKISKVMTGTPNDQIAPIPIFRCDDCGVPLKDMMPPKEEEKEEPQNKMKLLKK